jgi:PAS domain S-box-containing protein
LRMVGTNSNITERELGALIYLHSSQGVLISDADNHIVCVNPAFMRITGYTDEDVIGKNPSSLASGRQNPQFYQKMWQAIETTGYWEGEIVNKRKDGVLYTESLRISTVKDDEGKVDHYIALFVDISQQKKIEDQLLHSQKIETLGTLSGGIAHDFNNILSAILGYSELVAEKVSPENTISDDVQQIIGATVRAADLVEQILAFSRHTETEKQFLLPHVIIKEVLMMMRATLPTSIAIEEFIDSGCGTIFANPTNIHQVAVNLYTNARQAMIDDKGIIRIELRRLVVHSGEIPADQIAEPGDFVMLRISDDGCGIPKENLKKIFDPYYTTKEIGEGTGLGLSVVHGIVRACKGFCKVISSGEGTIFEVYFPAYNEELEQQEKALPDKVPVEHKGSEKKQGKILIVDDEPLLVHINMKRLENRGYQVEGVTDSRKAYEIFCEQPDSFALLITDQTMPGFTGIELVKKILQVRADLPVILCTGHSEMISESKALAMNITAFVRKPLYQDELLNAVQKVLG